MRDVTARNRQIKQIMAQAFPGRKVTVRAVRGSMCYGRADIHIDFTPRDRDQSRELEALCFQAFASAKVAIGSNYTDDTCQYQTPEVSVNFNSPRFFRTHRYEDGSMAVIREWGGEWESA